MTSERLTALTEQRDYLRTRIENSPFGSGRSRWRDQIAKLDREIEALKQSEKDGK